MVCGTATNRSRGNSHTAVCELAENIVCNCHADSLRENCPSELIGSPIEAKV